MQEQKTPSPWIRQLWYLLGLSGLLVGGVAGAATITVDTLVDEWNTGGSCSIREALDSVRLGSDQRGCTATGAYGSNDTIQIPSGLYTITRTSGTDDRSNFDLDVEADVLIVGEGGNDDGTRIDGGGATRIIEILPGVSATLRYIQFQNGRSSLAYVGGAIHNRGDLTLEYCTITGNVGTDYAAGGMGNRQGSTLFMNGCLITDNTNAYAPVGAGVDVDGGHVVIRNSTFSANNGDGPGLYGYTYGAGDVDVLFTTFNNNVGGSYNGNFDGGTGVGASILNAGCGGAFRDRGYNRAGGTGCGFTAATSLQNVTIGLDPLAYNGGSTLNHAIDNTDTLAYDQVPSGTLGCGTAPLDSDQRTAARPDSSGGANCDIGAYEYDPTFTDAVVTGFRIFQTDIGRVFSWRSESEVGTLGYVLERFDVEKGRFVRVNDEPVPATMAGQGGSYLYLDNTGAEGLFRLVELTMGGRSRIHAELVVEQNASAGQQHVEPAITPELSAQLMIRGYYRQSHQQTASGEASVAQRIPTQQQITASAGTLKIGIQADGLYYVDVSTIAAKLGMSIEEVSARLDSGRFRLSNRGNEIAWTTVPARPGLYFYGRGLDSPFTLDNVYWLEPTAGLRMSRRSNNAREAGGRQIFPETRVFEEDAEPFAVIADNQDQDYWYWSYLIGGHSTFGSVSLDVSLVDVAETGLSQVVLRLKGAELNGFGLQYHVVVKLNGMPRAEESWVGGGDRNITFTLDASDLLEGNNVLEIESLDVAGNAASLLLVDGVEVSYPRYKQARGDVLEFSASSSGTMTVLGYTSPDVLVLDITDVSRPQVISDVLVEQDIGGLVTGIFDSSFENDESPAVVATSGEAIDRYQISFDSPGGTVTSRYLVSSLTAASSPAWVEADYTPTVDPMNIDADYVLVAPAGMEGPALNLAALRQRKGYSTAVVSLEDIYDAFNDGIASPHAIKDMIQHNQANLHFVVLLGEGSFDFRNLQGYGDSLVPPWMVSSPHGLFASDMGYGDIDGDGVPEVLVSRIPVATATELQDYVNKLETQENSTDDRVYWMADNSDFGGDFEDDMYALSALLPAAVSQGQGSLQTTTIDDARAALFSELQAGVGLVDYMGHGSVLSLAAEKWLTVGDVAELGNAGHYPVLAALTCVVNRYGLPGYDSLGEQLVLAPASGMSAVFAPSGLSLHDGGKLLNKAFIRAVYGAGKTVLGDAILHAMAEYAGVGQRPYMLGIYNLLGDPAIEMTVPATDPSLLAEPLYQEPPVYQEPPPDGVPPAR